MKQQFLLCVLVSLVSCCPGEYLEAQGFDQKPIHSFFGQRPIAFSADENLMAYACRIGGFSGIAIWDLQAGEELVRAKRDTLGISDPVATAFLPDNSRLVFYDSDGSAITLWDFKSDNQQSTELPENGRGRSSGPNVFSRDVRLLALVGSTDRRSRVVYVWDRVANRWLCERDVIGFVRQLIFSSDTQSLRVLESRYSKRKKKFEVYVHQWSLIDAELTHQYGPFPMLGSMRRHEGRGMGQIRLSDDGQTLVTTLAGNGALVINVKNGERRTIGPHPSSTRDLNNVFGEFGPGFSTVFRSMAFAPQGDSLATGAAGSAAVFLWPLNYGTELRRLDQAGLGAVWNLLFSRTGRLLAVGGIPVVQRTESKIHIWRVPNDQ